MSDVTVSEVARRVDVSPGTLRRWVRERIVALPAGSGTPTAIAHARMPPRAEAATTDPAAPTSHFLAPMAHPAARRP